MNHSLKRQQGYLALIVALLIITVAFGSLITAYIFSNKAQSINYSLLSMQAYYLAESGIERAKYDITVNNLDCTSINGTANYTNATFSGAQGEFTVTVTQSENATTLNGALTAAATSVVLTNASGFASSGTIKIDSEYINYTTISSNTLTGLTRGVGGTTAAAHSNSASVNQNQCVLSATGAVPSIASPLTKRVIQTTLLGSSLSTGDSSPGGGAGSGVYQAALIVGGSVSIGGGGTVTNSGVTSTSGNFAGSTIQSGGPVVFNGSGKTQVSNGSGGLVTSSSSGTIRADVVQNSADVNAANLWSNFFSQSKTTVQASANQSYTSSNINGATGQTIWIKNLTLNGNTTIGSATSPVILIVEGNLNTNGGLTFNGLLYVTGSASFGGNTTINGLLSMEGAFNTNGNTTINYNSGILTLIGKMNSSVTTTYSPVPSNVQEQFA